MNIDRNSLRIKAKRTLIEGEVRIKPELIVWKGSFQKKPIARQKKPTDSTADQFLEQVNSWPDARYMEPVSQSAKEMIPNGYLALLISLGGQSYVQLCLGRTAEDIVEIQTIEAVPPKQRGGSEILKRLCCLADQLQIKLWLNAIPFGDKRFQMNVSRLKAWYRTFRFNDQPTIDPTWINVTHRRDLVRFNAVMVRAPQQPKSSL